MAKSQLKYVVVDPGGVIKGPVWDDPEFVKEALCVGARRAGLSGEWEDIEAMGYSVRLARITLLEV